MDQHLQAAEFYHKRNTHVVLDVRSPGEYQQGHIPGAHSFPLFSDDERAQVGTIYKKEGKNAAVLLGLKFAGPKMAGFVEQARALAPGGRLAVHCWRGGQRSQSMAWLFRQAGFDVCTLEGGYKRFRKLVLETFHQLPLKFIVIGGQTGSGKTKVLHALQDLGEQIIDLEALAHHKGSAFGHIGEPEQPTVEQFENNLFEQTLELDSSRCVWIENESQSIGRVFIPQEFWQHMKRAPLFNIEIPFKNRIDNLVQDYARVSNEELVAAFQRIEKKLGGQHLKAALESLGRGNHAAAAEIALNYYDKTYRYGLENNPSPEIHQLKFEAGNPKSIALECLQVVRQSGRKPVPLNTDH